MGRCEALRYAGGGVMDRPDMLTALHDIDEFCQQGLNSPHAEHWEAALHDIMELVRAVIAQAKEAA